MINLRHLWTHLHSSFWFIPAVMVSGFVALAVLLVYVDESVEREVLEQWPRLFGAGADGSRAMLLAIAQSMITVAGVVFSITIVALSMTSNQFSPRILRTFMQSTTTQMVLGTFVGTFAYCLVVLRTIRSGDDDERFVPAVAVLAGVVLALVGVAVLIYFIHHIATSIQVTTILQEITAETLAAVDHLFPDDVGNEAEEDRLESDQMAIEWVIVPASGGGYLQNVSEESLLKWAERQDTVLRMEARVGQFVPQGGALAAVPRSCPLDQAAVEELNRAFALDRFRTIDQDATFGIQLLVDIALKALSTGVNDSRTAISCVDHLLAILLRVAKRRVASPERSVQGRLRVIAYGPTFRSLVEDAFEPLRRCGDFAVLQRLTEAIETVAGKTSNRHRRAVLVEQLRRVGEACRERIPSEHDREQLQRRLDQAEQRVEARWAAKQIRDTAPR